MQEQRDYGHDYTTRVGITLSVRSIGCLIARLYYESGDHPRLCRNNQDTAARQLIRLGSPSTFMV